MINILLIETIYLLTRGIKTPFPMKPLVVSRNEKFSRVLKSLWIPLKEKNRKKIQLL